MHVEVKEHDPGIAKEYMVQEYPGPGFYLNRRMGYIFYVYTMPGTLTPTVMGMPSVGASVKEDAPPEPVPQGMSENFVLKALAICQNPNLAAALTGKV